MTTSALRCICSILLTSLLFSTWLTGQITELKIQTIDQLLQQHNGDQPGCVVGIIYRGDLIYKKGFGKARLKDALPFDPQSSFYIGSLSKQFIATGIGLLALEGKIDLEDELTKYVPELSNIKEKITIRNLLDHTSGIKDYSNLMFMRGDFFPDFITLERAIQLLSRQSALNFKPGGVYSYSNSNYMLLAEIISRVSGMDFRKYIDREIFQPLGMQQTTFTDNNTKQAASKVIGYFMDNNGRYQPFTNYPPVTQDQILTSLEDFYLWDQNSYHKKVGGEPLQQMLGIKGQLSDGQSINYAFGTQSGQYKGLDILTHGGYLRGYDSYYLRIPGEQLSVVVFANSPKVNAYQTTYAIVDILLGDQLTDTPAGRELEPLPTIELSNKALQEYCGSYWYAAINEARIIYLRRDTLRYNRPDTYESPLVPVGQDQFRRLDAGGRQTAHITFQTLTDGHREMLIRSLENDELLMPQFEKPKYNGRQIKQYLGRYHCADLDIDYELTLEKGLIRTWINGVRKSRLRVLKTDVFNDDYFGIFKFIRDGSSSVEGFYLSTDRARDLYFTKTL